MGNGVAVAAAVGLGESIDVVEAADTVDVAAMLVISGEGAGGDVQALTRMRDRANVRRRDFMRAIMAETRGRVNTTKTGAREQSRPWHGTAFTTNSQSI